METKTFSREHEKDPWTRAIQNKRISKKREKPFYFWMSNPLPSILCIGKEDYRRQFPSVMLEIRRIRNYMKRGDISWREV